MNNPPKTLFDRLIGWPRHRWIPLGVSVLMVLIPLLLAWNLVAQGQPLESGPLRGLLTAPLVLLYIVLITPRMDRMEKDVVRSLRPAILVDDENFGMVVSKSAHTPILIEFITVVVGILFGVVTIGRIPGIWLSAIGIYWILSSVIMYAVLFLTVVSSLASTRLTPSLLRQPIRVDLFDISPFEAIGRQSLLIALVFIGGITLSLLISNFQPGILRRIDFWLVYGPLVLVPIAIFFLTMQPIHRILAAAKNREMGVVKKKINQIGREIMDCLNREAEAATKAQIINALIAYEQRLHNARTWPYNTSMLRTLFFSVLVPAGTLIGRILLNIFYSN